MDDRVRGDGRLSRGVGRRRLLKATGGGALGLSLAGCLDDVTRPIGIAGAEDEPIRIGVLAPRPDRDLIGRSTAHGAELAAAELNAGEGFSGVPDMDNFREITELRHLERTLGYEGEREGGPAEGVENAAIDVDGLLESGILGRDVEILVRDTKGNPSEARRQYQQLVIEENVDMTMGIFVTEALAHVIHDIAAQETLHITVGSASSVPNALINADYERYKYHFRLGPFADILLVRNQIDFMRDMRGEMGWDNVAVLTEGYEWAQDLGPAFELFLPGIGLDVVHQEHYPPANRDFISRYQAAIDAGADAILAGMSHTGDEAIIQWAEMGRPLDFGGIHIPAQRPDYYDLRAIDGAVEGAIGQTIATDTMRDQLPPIDGLLSAYQAAYDGETPMFTGYSSYTAMLVYATVVQAAGTTDPEVLIPTLESIHFDSPTGPIEFHDRTEDNAHDPRYGEEFIQGVFFQWQNGRQEVIWPERFATSSYVPPS